MTQEWRDIPGFPGYQVTANGLVRSVTRKVRCIGGFRTVQGRILSQFPSKSTGYYQVDVSSKRQSVHRLIALAWVPGHFDGAWVDHLNGNRKDNRAVNLEWVTRSENAARPYANGSRSGTCLGKLSSDHPTAKPVMSKCIKTGKITAYASAMDAVRAGFDSGSISHCCAGRIAHHKGHVWRKGVVWTDPNMEQAA